MKQVILTIITVVAALAVAAQFPTHSAGGAAAPAQPAYERVMASSTLRCGYGYWHPGIFKNEQTGEISGFYPDVMVEIGRALGLEVVFVSETPWANVAADLKTGKIDAMCAGMWQSAMKSDQLHFSTPVHYQGVEAFARARDDRFDDDLSLANTEGITLAIIDNDNSAYIAVQQFPHAKTYALPVGAADTELLLAVQTGKADLTFTAPGVAYGYLKSNPGKLKRVQPGNYLRVFGNTLVTHPDEHKLAHMLEIALAELKNAGTIDRLIDKWEIVAPGSFIKPQKDYQ